MSWEESPLFNVVLIDAQGGEHGYIGYQFGAAGAKAAADSWNAMAERRYTAVIRPVALPTPETKTESGDSEKVAAIREAVLGYYTALDNREHGGIAEAAAFKKIENVLGMHWSQGERTR